MQPCLVSPRPAALAGRGQPIVVDMTLAAAMSRLQVTVSGLTAPEAATRLGEYGPNRLHDDDGNHPFGVLFRHFRSPMVLILLGAAMLVTSEFVKRRIELLGPSITGPAAV